MELPVIHNSPSSKEETYTPTGICKPIIILPIGFGFEYGQWTISIFFLSTWWIYWTSPLGHGTLYRVKHTPITHNGRRYPNRRSPGHTFRRAHIGWDGYSAYYNYGRRAFTCFWGSQLIHNHFFPSQRKHLWLPKGISTRRFIWRKRKATLWVYLRTTSNFKSKWLYRLSWGSGYVNSHCTTSDI